MIVVHGRGIGEKTMEDGLNQNSLKASIKFTNPKRNDQNSRISNLYIG